MKMISEYQTPQLQAIFHKLRYLQDLQTKVAKLLPAELRPVCRVANREGIRLTLAVASSAWAMRLRYALPELRQQLLPENITLIDFYIEPEFEKLFGEKTVS